MYSSELRSIVGMLKSAEVKEDGIYIPSQLLDYSMKPEDLRRRLIASLESSDLREHPFTKLVTINPYDHSKTYKCPCCHATIRLKDNYCRYCGTHLSKNVEASMNDYVYLLGYLRRLCRNHRKNDFHSATIETDKHGVVHISAVDNDYLSLDYQKSTEWFNIVDRPQAICDLLNSWGFHLDTYFM